MPGRCPDPKCKHLGRSGCEPRDETLIPFEAREVCPTAAPGISSPGDTKSDAQELHFGHPHFLPRLVLLPGQYPKALAVEICISPTGLPLRPFPLICGSSTPAPPTVTPELQGPSLVCREQPVPVNPGCFHKALGVFWCFLQSCPSVLPLQCLLHTLSMEGGAHGGSWKSCRGFTAIFNSQGPGTETSLSLHKSVILHTQPVPVAVKLPSLIHTTPFLEKRKEWGYHALKG